MVNKPVTSAVEFYSRLDACDSSAWNWLYEEVNRRFHKPDVAGMSSEDFASEAITRFMALLTDGLVDLGKHPVPFILCIATHLWIDWVRKNKRQTYINNSPEEEQSEEDLGKMGSEMKTPFTLLDESEERKLRQEKASCVLEACNKDHGPAASFRLLQAIMLDTKALNRLWCGTSQGSSIRTTQRRRSEILNQTRLDYYDYQGSNSDVGHCDSEKCNALLTRVLENP